MASTTTATKRIKLRLAYADSVTEAVPFLDKLIELAETAEASISTGQTLSSVSRSSGASSHSVSYSQPDTSILGASTPSNLLDMWSELIDLYEVALEYLGGTPTDEQIFNEMLGLLVPAKNILPPDFTCLGLA